MPSKIKTKTAADLTDTVMKIIQLGLVGSLNLNELKILDSVKDNSKSISDIAKELRLDYKNAWRYCRKLHDLKVIELIPPPSKSAKGVKVMVVSKLETAT